MGSRELLNLNHKTPDSTLEADHHQAAAVTMPTQDFSLEMEPLMLVLLELRPDLQDNMLLIRSSTHAPEEATEFLEETLETSFWELLEDSLQLLSLMLLLEVLVEDKNISSLNDLKLKSDCYKLLINVYDC